VTRQYSIAGGSGGFLSSVRYQSERVGSRRTFRGEAVAMLKEGWRGRYYEDFEVGDVYRHRLGRTVTESDNTLFTMLTLNTNPIHFDAHLAEKTPYGKILVNSCFTLSLAVGLSVSDLSEHVMANLGWNDIRLPSPVFIGDTITASSEVLGKRESESRPDVGIVTARTTGKNQRDETVISYERTFMVYKRGKDPRDTVA
jgi:acyl dehydratase